MNKTTLYSNYQSFTQYQLTTTGCTVYELKMYYYDLFDYVYNQMVNPTKLKLEERNMLKTELIREAKITSNSMARLGKNEDVRVNVLVAVVVGPGRFQMQAEDVALGLLQASVQFLEVGQTTLAPGIVVAPAPSATVEPGTRRVHDTVEHHMITMGIDEPLTLDVERRQRLDTLGRHAQSSNCCKQ